MEKPDRTKIVTPEPPERTQGFLTEFERLLVGKTCSIRRLEFSWAVSFAGGPGLMIEAPWRIVSNGRIAISAYDDGQMFGLGAPLDAQAEANRLLRGRVVLRASVDRETADLTLQFDGGPRLDVFNNSAGHEGWQASGASIAGEVWSVIALGGGDVAFVPD